MKQKSELSVFLTLLGLVFLAMGIFAYSRSCWQLGRLKPSENAPDITSSRIKLPLNKMQCLHGVDSTYTENTFSEMTNTFYKMLVYTDSTNCTPCAIDRIHAWNDVIEQFEKYKVKWIFIISPQKEKIEDTYLAIEYSYLKSAIYVDTAYVFRKENENILNNVEGQAILLDNDNNIVVIGNPQKDVNVQLNMIRTLQEKLNNNN